MEANSSVNVSETRSVDDSTVGVPQWAEMLVIFIMSIVTLFGIPGNGIILIVQWKNRDKSSTDILVSTMAAFELFCAGFNSVLIILSNIPVIWTALASVAICRIHKFSIYITSISSTLLLTAIAIDRYFQTCKPLNIFYSKKKVKWICITIIATSSIVSLPSLFTDTFDKRRFTCETKGEYPVLLYILDLCLAIAFFIMFIAVVFCYTKVAMLIRRRLRQKVTLRPAQASTSVPLTNSTQLTTLSQKRNLFGSKKNRIHPQSVDVNLKDEFATENKSIQRHGKDILEEKDKTRENNKKQLGKSYPNAAQINIDQAKLVHRTTLIMFLITTIYISSWVVHWVSHALISDATLESRAVVYLFDNLYMVNCVTNPIFFISLSSKFRKQAETFLRRRH